MADGEHAQVWSHVESGDPHGGDCAKALPGAGESSLRALSRQLGIQSRANARKRLLAVNGLTAGKACIPLAAKLFYGLRALHAALGEGVAHFLDIGHRRVLHLFLQCARSPLPTRGEKAANRP